VRAIGEALIDEAFTACPATAPQALLRNRKFCGNGFARPLVFGAPGYEGEISR